MEQSHKAKARAQAEEWDPAVEIAGEAAVIALAREENVFVQTVEKESLIN